MLYIAKFAKEIGVDSISYQKLRIEKFSPLKEVVENTPGYYYERIGGHVFSDKYGPKELKQIRNRIRSEFYDVPQLLRIAAQSPADRAGHRPGHRRHRAQAAADACGQWIKGRIEKRGGSTRPPACAACRQRQRKIPVAAGDQDGQDRRSVSRCWMVRPANFFLRSGVGALYCAHDEIQACFSSESVLW